MDEMICVHDKKLFLEQFNRKISMTPPDSYREGQQSEELLKLNFCHVLNKMIAQNKRLLGIVLSVTLIVMIPFIAMQFSNEVNWSSSDFIIAECLLLGTGLILELIIRKVNKKRTRIMLIIVILTILLLIWLELAVGIFGTPLAGS
jgi:ABC-type cobalt transport system substrate-binding protein